MLLWKAPVFSQCQHMHLSNDIALSYDSFGIKNVYDWQIECILGSCISNSGSLVYCAPTSGGKTLISELCILQSAMYFKLKAIFILPYVSLVLEKEHYFKS